jgi:hypothetical protein
MTNEERITALESAREHDRAEIAALQKVLLDHELKVCHEVETLGKDFELTRDALDERIGGLAELEPAVAKALMEVLTPVRRLFEKQTDALEGLLDRVERIERLVQPALSGPCEAHGARGVKLAGFRVADASGRTGLGTPGWGCPPEFRPALEANATV